MTLAIDLYKFGFEVTENFGEQPSKSVDDIPIEYAIAITW